MMKIATAWITAAFAAVAILPDDADAQTRSARAKAKQGRIVARSEVRPPSVGPNGLCQRDTGTPMDKLNFRNRCDVEEYWARIIERPNAGDR